MRARLPGGGRLPRCRSALFAAALALAALACSGPPRERPAPRPLEQVDDARLRAASRRAAELADLRRQLCRAALTASSRRSTRTTSTKLGLAWYFDTELPRGHEATPIVVDGVIYTTGSLERGVRDRRAHGEAALAPRPAGAARDRRHRVLRRGEPRRRRLPRARLRRRRSTAGSRRSTRRRGERGLVGR